MSSFSPTSHAGPAVTVELRRLRRGPERSISPVPAGTPVRFLHRLGLHVVPTATERTSALAENSHVAT